MDKLNAIMKMPASARLLRLFIATGASLAIITMFLSKSEAKEDKAFAIKTGVYQFTFRAHDTHEPSAKDLREMSAEARERTLTKTYKAPINPRNIGYMVEGCLDYNYRLDASAKGKNSLLVSSNADEAKLENRHNNGVDYITYERLSDKSYRVVTYIKWSDGRIEQLDDQVAKWRDEDCSKMVSN